MFSTVNNICRRKYFACLIFVGRAHGRKFLAAKISSTMVIILQ